MVKALVDVSVNDFIPEGLQGPPGGDDLHKDFGAIRVGEHHALDALELAADFMEPGDERLLLAVGVDVLHGLDDGTGRPDRPAE